MVQKLIFDDIILYAHNKVNKIKTINDWFKPQEEPSSNTQDSNINTSNAIVSIKSTKMEKHEIKIKRNKQTTLDKFF